MIEKSESQRKREAARGPARRKKASRKPAPTTVVEANGEIVVFGNGTPLRFRRRRRRVSIDPPRLLRASPHGADYESIRSSYDDEGVPRDLHDAGADAVAAEESGYTASQSSALSMEPEAVSQEEQERQSRRVRIEKEKIVVAPLHPILDQLAELEASGLYKPGKVKFIRKLVAQLGEDAMRSTVAE